MLYLVATPIGNLEDISLRALRVLKEVDYILAEDTRKTQQLLKHYAIEKAVYSFFEHNENHKTPKVIEELLMGAQIALVSDAGVPTISDPGYKLVRDGRKAGVEITALPGPCSVIDALALSSAPRDKFSFIGYIPKKPGERKKILCKILADGITTVAFESPYRLAKTLAEAGEIFGGTQITVARELSKKYEEVIEGTAADLAARFVAQPSKGEHVIIFHRPEADKKGGVDVREKEQTRT